MRNLQRQQQNRLLVLITQRGLRDREIPVRKEEQTAAQTEEKAAAHREQALGQDRAKEVSARQEIRTDRDVLPDPETTEINSVREEPRALLPVVRMEETMSAATEEMTAETTEETRTERTDALADRTVRADSVREEEAVLSQRLYSLRK